MHKFKSGDLVKLNAKAYEDKYLIKRYGFILAEVLELYGDLCPIIVVVVNCDPIATTWLKHDYKNGIRYSASYLDLVLGNDCDE